MRLDNGTVYPPDNLMYPVVYGGDSAIQGILGQPTLATLTDIWGARGPASDAAQGIADRYGNTSQNPGSAPQSSDPCDRYDKTSIDYWLCKTTDIGTHGMGAEVYNKGQDLANGITSFGGDMLNRGGLLVLGLLIIAIGLWAALK